MCECCGDKEEHTAYTRVAIVIREKFIRPKTLGIEVQGHKHGSFSPNIINSFESNNCSCRVSSSVTFKTWVRFPSAPPRDYI